jgi:hypothetical protein
MVSKVSLSVDGLAYSSSQNEIVICHELLVLDLSGPYSKAHKGQGNGSKNHIEGNNQLND